MKNNFPFVRISTKRFFYNEKGQFEKVCSHRDHYTDLTHETFFEYDEKGNRIRKYTLDGNINTLYRYDENNMNSSVVIFAGTDAEFTINYEYDEKGHMIKEYDENNVTTYSYDEYDNIVSVNENGIVTTYENKYDDSGRLTNIITRDEHYPMVTTEFGYDDHNNISFKVVKGLDNDSSIIWQALTFYEYENNKCVFEKKSYIKYKKYIHKDCIIEENKV